MESSRLSSFALSNVALAILLLPIPSNAQSRTAYTAASIHSSAINLTHDLQGTPDQRQQTWGSTAYIDSAFTFSPPPGYRVRLLRVYGDFISWPKEGVMAPGTYAEVGLAINTTAPEGSQHLTLSADNCPLWLQNVVLPGNPSPRLHFDYDVSVGGLLGADNTFKVLQFVALNTSGLVIHMEPTFVVVYQFEASE